MKIPKPTRPEAPPFKRKRAPPPQATKLLLASLLAALVFMGALAVVFIPRYLENLNPPPTTLVLLDLNTSARRLVVSNVLYAYPLAKFNATLALDNATIGSLGAGLAGSGGALNFTDANHDGLLDTGDYFGFTAQGQGTYRLEVWQVDVGVRVGFVRWTGTP